MSADRVRWLDVGRPALQAPSLPGQEAGHERGWGGGPPPPTTVQTDLLRCCRSAKPSPAEAGPLVDAAPAPVVVEEGGLVDDLGAVALGAGRTALVVTGEARSDATAGRSKAVHSNHPVPCSLTCAP